VSDNYWRFITNVARRQLAMPLNQAGHHAIRPTDKN